MNNRFSRLGFTLIEILLALTLATIILTAVLSVFRGAIFSWSFMKYDVRCLKIARMVFTQLEQDLRNLVVSTGKLNSIPLTEMRTKGVSLLWYQGIDAKQINKSGSKDVVLGFAVARSGSIKNWQLQWVEYHFEEQQTQPQARYSIYRRVYDALTYTQDSSSYPNLPLMKKQFLVEEGLEDFSVNFLEWEAEQFKLTNGWFISEGGESQWKPGFPKAIEVTLVFPQKRGHRPKWTKIIPLPHALGI